MRSYSDFAEALRQRESSGDYQAVNQFGFLGAYQFGELALIDLGYYEWDGSFSNNWNADNFTGKDGIHSREDFLNSPEVQDAAAQQWFALQWRYIRNLDLETYDGQTLNGVTLTQSGLIAGAHLVGAGGLRDFLESGGVTAGQDGNGVSLVEYITLFEGFETPDSFLNNLEKDNAISGGIGRDTLNGFEGQDTLLGEAGADRLNGGAGQDYLEGGDGSDLLYGGKGSDHLLGGRGRDFLFGGRENDRLDGQFGRDDLRGGLGQDTLLGRAGHDELRGGGGDDRLLGNGGNDTLLGGGGRDVLVVGNGQDVLIGGAARDRFVFERLPEEGSQVTLSDIAASERVILRALDVDQVVSGDTMLQAASEWGPEDDLLLVSANSRVTSSDTGQPVAQADIGDVLNTDANWVLLSVADGEYRLVSEIFGDVTEDQFLI